MTKAKYTLAKPLLNGILHKSDEKKKKKFLCMSLFSQRHDTLLTSRLSHFDFLILF
jgi:hypothetical protein